MARDRDKEIEEAVADGDWKKVYELERAIEQSETKTLLKGFIIGYSLGVAGITVGGAAVYLIKKMS